MRIAPDMIAHRIDEEILGAKDTMMAETNMWDRGNQLLVHLHNTFLEVADDEEQDWRKSVLRRSQSWNGVLPFDRTSPWDEEEDTPFDGAPGEAQDPRLVSTEPEEVEAIPSLLRDTRRTEDPFTSLGIPSLCPRPVLPPFLRPPAVAEQAPWDLRSSVDLQDGGRSSPAEDACGGDLSSLSSPRGPREDHDLPNEKVFRLDLRPSLDVEPFGDDGLAICRLRIFATDNSAVEAELGRIYLGLRKPLRRQPRETIVAQPPRTWAETVAEAAVAVAVAVATAAAGEGGLQASNALASKSMAKKKASIQQELAAEKARIVAEQERLRIRIKAVEEENLRKQEAAKEAAIRKSAAEEEKLRLAEVARLEEERAVLAMEEAARAAEEAAKEKAKREEMQTYRKLAKDGRSELLNDIKESGPARHTRDKLLEAKERMRNLDELARRAFEGVVSEDLEVSSAVARNLNERLSETLTILECAIAEAEQVIENVNKDLSREAQASAPSMDDQIALQKDRENAATAAVGTLRDAREKAESVVSSFEVDEKNVRDKIAARLREKTLQSSLDGGEAQAERQGKALERRGEPSTERGDGMVSPPGAEKGVPVVLDEAIGTVGTLPGQGTSKGARKRAAVAKMKKAKELFVSQATEEPSPEVRAPTMGAGPPSDSKPKTKKKKSAKAAGDEAKPKEADDVVDFSKVSKLMELIHSRRKKVFEFVKDILPEMSSKIRTANFYHHPERRWMFVARDPVPPVQQDRPVYNNLLPQFLGDGTLGAAGFVSEKLFRNGKKGNNKNNGGLVPAPGWAEAQTTLATELEIFFESRNDKTQCFKKLEASAESARAVIAFLNDLFVLTFLGRGDGMENRPDDQFQKFLRNNLEFRKEWLRRADEEYKDEGDAHPHEYTFSNWLATGFGYHLQETARDTLLARFTHSEEALLKNGRNLADGV